MKENKMNDDEIKTYNILRQIISLCDVSPLSVSYIEDACYKTLNDFKKDIGERIIRESNLD